MSEEGDRNRLVQELLGRGYLVRSSVKQSWQVHWRKQPFVEEFWPFAWHAARDEHFRIISTG